MKIQQPGKAWGYHFGGDKGTFNDTSVSAFVMMALKDAKLCGIKFDYSKACKGLTAYYQSICTGKHKGIGQYRSIASAPLPRRHSNTAIVLLCRQLMGKRRSNPAIKEGVEYILQEGIKYSTTGRFEDDEGLYYVYYASLGMFQYGGKEWKKWNKMMKPALLKAQIKGGCADGSWPVANDKEIPNYFQKRFSFEKQAGKVYTTTLAILTLEVYYRYSPLFR